MVVIRLEAFYYYSSPNSRQLMGEQWCLGREGELLSAGTAEGGLSVDKSPSERAHAGLGKSVPQQEEPPGERLGGVGRS